MMLRKRRRRPAAGVVLRQTVRASASITKKNGSYAISIEK